MGQTDVVRKFVPPPLADYVTARSAFTWEALAADFGADPASMNLGALATEHQLGRGRRNDAALIWIGGQGEIERFSYAELSEASARVANFLAGYGVEAGDRVLFLLPTIPELYTGILGALRAGAIPGVLAGGRNIDYLRHALAGTRPRALVTVPSFRNALSSLRPFVPELRTLFLVNRAKGMPGALDDGEVRWEGAYAAASAAFAPVPTAPESAGWVNFSDQGASAAAVAHRAALPLYHTARSVLEMGPGETVLSVTVPGEGLFMPYSVLAPLLSGSTLVALEDPARFGRFAQLAAESESCVWFSSFRALDVMLRVEPNLGIFLKKCRNISCTWPYDEAFVQMTMMSYGSPVHGVWTERELGAIQCAELRGCAIRPGSVGRPVPGVQLRVAGGDGSPVGPGTPGKLAVKLGPAAPFVEYWDDPERTANGARDGWFVTGRTAKMDGDGYVWIQP